MKKLLFSLTLLPLLGALGSCCSLPPWLLGRDRIEVSVPADLSGSSTVTYTLCPPETGGSAHKGLVELDKKEIGRAIEHFRAAVEETGEQDANTLFMLGIAYELDADYELAVECYDKASILAPKQMYIDSFKRAKQMATSG